MDKNTEAIIAQPHGQEVWGYLREDGTFTAREGEMEALWWVEQTPGRWQLAKRWMGPVEVVER